MRRADRLFRLIGLMRAQDLTRAEDLATALEVSVRTIYRDIAHLQGSGLPIEGAAGIGYLLRPGFDLPAMTFTHEQLDALALGLKFVEEAGDRGMVMAAKEVRAKLENVLPEGSKSILSKAPFFAARRGFRAPAFAALLRRAIRERLTLNITYRQPEAAATSRHVRPLSLTVFSEGWMMAAWCELREDFRYFRLDRIIEVSPSGRTFPIDPAKSLTAFRQQKAHNSAAYT